MLDNPGWYHTINGGIYFCPDRVDYSRLVESIKRNDRPQNAPTETFIDKLVKTDQKNKE